MKHPWIPALCGFATALCVGGAVLAGPGHDHDHDHGKDTSSSTPAAVAPRFAAVSESFELVGVLDGARLTLYLDHADTNVPVREGRIELELGGASHLAETDGEGVFVLSLAQVPTAGVIPVTATVTAGQEADLLAGELDLGHGRDVKPERAVPYRAVMGAVLLVVLLASVLMWRRLRGRKGGVA